MHDWSLGESVTLQWLVQASPIGVVSAHVHHEVAEEDALWDENIFRIVALSEFVYQSNVVSWFILPFYFCHLEGLDQECKIEEVARSEHSNGRIKPRLEEGCLIREILDPSGERPIGAFYWVKLMQLLGKYIDFDATIEHSNWTAHLRNILVG